MLDINPSSQNQPRQPLMKVDTSSLQTPHHWFTKKRLILLIVLILISFLIIVLTFNFLILRSSDQQASSDRLTPSITPSSTLPLDASVSKITGTQSTNLVATRDASPSGFGYANRNVTLFMMVHSVVAVLPKPAQGEFYEGWLIKNQHDYYSIGTLWEEKRGYFMLNSGWLFLPDQIPLSSFNDYPRIIISLETIKDDIIEKRLLVGQFTKPEQQ